MKKVVTPERAYIALMKTFENFSEGEKQELRKLIWADARLSSEIGWGIIMRTLDLAREQNDNDRLRPLAEELLIAKRRRKEPKDDDTKPITIKIFKLKKSLTWREVFETMIARYPKQWKTRKSMKASYLATKRKHPEWFKGG